MSLRSCSLRLCSLSMVIATCLLTTELCVGDELTRSVSVTGTAVAKVKPDAVLWTISVTTTDPNLKAAREENDLITATVLDLRSKLKIDAKDIQTGHISIRKIYERDRSGNQGAFRHFAFYRSIAIRQRSTSGFDNILQELTGTENIEVSYALEASNFHDVRKSTRLRAVEIAKEKATDMTELLDAKIGHVLTISETPTNDRWGGSPVSNVAYYAGTPAEPDDIEGTFAPGSIEVRVSVDVSFAIE